jgi:hypothetical protein
MAVDRNGVAWVTDKTGLLYKVSTTDASCQPTAFQNQHGFTKVGMGFAGYAAEGTETLYVVDNSNASLSSAGQGLASINLASLALNPIANFDGALAGLGAELTGTGDGHLYGFFPVDSSIDLIDPATARIVSRAPVALPVPAGSGEYDFAFSFWGGDFFTYVAWGANPAGTTTDVTLFDPATGATSLVLPQIGFNVIGAGSSTCVTTHGDVHVFPVPSDAGPWDAGPTDDAADTE